MLSTTQAQVNIHQNRNKESNTQLENLNQLHILPITLTSLTLQEVVGITLTDTIWTTKYKNKVKAMCSVKVKEPTSYLQT